MMPLIPPKDETSTNSEIADAARGPAVASVASNAICVDVEDLLERQHQQVGRC